MPWISASPNDRAIGIGAVLEVGCPTSSHPSARTLASDGAPNLYRPQLHTPGHALSTTSPHCSRRCLTLQRCFMSLGWATHVSCAFLRHALHLKPINHARQSAPCCPQSVQFLFAVRRHSLSLSHNWSTQVSASATRTRLYFQNLHVSRISFTLDGSATKFQAISSS